MTYGMRELWPLFVRVELWTVPRAHHGAPEPGLGLFVLASPCCGMCG